ncbi:MAG: minor capsid protein, partial [Clostridia bacterium]|nr:minor capsid protein [Clostridia bacterium]
MSSKNYWVKRAVKLEQSIQDGATGAVNNIAKAYERAIANINHEIQQIFREFAKASNLSEEVARKIINTTTSKDIYKDLVKLFNETEDKKTRREIETKINRQAYGARIDRLEAVKERAYIELKKAQNTETEVHKALHKETLQKSYYTNIYNTAKGLDAGVNFSLLPKKAIEKALNANWLGSNYSKRIWNNNEQFISKVQQTIEDGIIGGHSISKMADKLCEYVKSPNSGQRYIAERLVRTETAHFMAEGQLEAYKEIGIKRYQFVSALSENTCIDCGNLDGEEFDVAEARAGDNYPPMHANCRCATVIAGTSSATRIARDPLTGKNYKVDGSMTFAEWKDSLSDEQRAMLKYVDKSAGSGIIKVGSGRIMSINNIDSPIEQRNTGKGNPSGIIHVGRPL